jgi:hypothetical protein
MQQLFCTYRLGRRKKFYILWHQDSEACNTLLKMANSYNRSEARNFSASIRETTKGENWAIVAELFACFVPPFTSVAFEVT